jgi:hypothetical protein
MVPVILAVSSDSCLRQVFADLQPADASQPWAALRAGNSKPDLFWVNTRLPGTFAGAFKPGVLTRFAQAGWCYIRFQPEVVHSTDPRFAGYQRSPEERARCQSLLRQISIVIAERGPSSSSPVRGPVESVVDILGHAPPPRVESVIDDLYPPPKALVIDENFVKQFYQDLLKHPEPGSNW